MENDLTYNQAVFGLMLLGAKADGKLQEEEKKLLVELTSEEHHLTPEEYKYVINEAKARDEAAFVGLIYNTLNAHPILERVKALYWLLQVIKSDRSSDDSANQDHNKDEMETYHKALVNLGINMDQVDDYEKSRND